MNVHLHHAISDLTGHSGLAITDAILDGERDPARLAALHALCGRWEPATTPRSPPCKRYRRIVNGALSCGTPSARARRPGAPADTYRV